MHKKRIGAAHVPRIRCGRVNQEDVWRRDDLRANCAAVETDLLLGRSGVEQSEARVRIHIDEAEPTNGQLNARI